MTTDVKTEIDQLQEIMAALPEHSDHTGPERREYSLTKGDVLLIYRIAKVASMPHVCPFEGEEANTLHSVATNIGRTQKIASGVVVVSIITAMLSGIWWGVTHLLKEFVIRSPK